MQQAILAGRTVLELGTMVAAPFAAHILGQLGATVTKVEPPNGDPTRNLVRGGPSGSFIAYNSGKRSICIDLRRPESQEIFRRLVAGSDVVVHNLAPDSARRLGVTFETCLQCNPDVVYCHIRGYGPGPMAEALASNPVAEAATGVMHSHVIDGRPSRLGPSYHDQFAGCYAVIGILTRLLGGKGGPGEQCIEVGLYESGLHVASRDLAGIQLKTQLLGKAEPEPSGEFSMPGYGSYQTSDGRWIYLVMLNDTHWARFWEAMACVPDPELATLRQRKKQREKVEMLIRTTMRQLTFDAAAARLNTVGFGFTEVLPMDRVLEAPQARKPPKFAEVPFQGFAFELPNLPIFGIAAGAENGKPPLLGEHTREILGSHGYTKAECETLMRNGVVAVPSTAPLWPGVRAPAAAG